MHSSDPHPPRQFPTTAPDPTVAVSPTVAAVHRHRRQSVLSCKSPNQPPFRFELLADHVIIGRGEDVDLNLRSAAVSRHHAAITRHDGELTITDLASTHGVLLNGVRVVSADLRDGDTLQLADVILTYDER